AEPIEPGVLKRESIFSLIHPEPARSARSRCEENIFIDDFLTRHPSLLEALKELHKIPDREISRIALSVIAEFLADLKSRDVGRRHDLAFISAALECGLNEFFVFPSKSAEQDRYLVALMREKRTFHGLLEVL